MNSGNDEGRHSRAVPALGRRLFPDRFEEQQRWLKAVAGSAQQGRLRCRLRSPAATRVEPGPAEPSFPSPLSLPPFVQPPGPGKDAHSSADPGAPGYILDLSSVLAAMPMVGLQGPLGTPPDSTSNPLRVLDLCAAPGGKTVFAWLALQPGYLLANEVIGKRLAILRHNLARNELPSGRVFTQRLDPSALAELAPEFFHLVLCDAPCSGQSLPARGVPNPGCFHKTIVQHNVKRQRRILNCAARMTAPGGFLLYTTCTFSVEENEAMIRWFLRRFPGWRAVDANDHLPDPGWQDLRSGLAEFACYRMYPHRGQGGGGFSCLLRYEPQEEPGSPASHLAAPPPELTAWPVKNPLDGTVH